MDRKNTDRRTCKILIILLFIITAAAVCYGALSAFGSGRSGTAHAETNPGGNIKVDVTGQKEGYSAVLYDNSNGLSTAEANAITETPDGFIWIGSYSGLTRYDGNTFERMDSTKGVASVRSLFVDSRGLLWIGTNESGVAMMDKGHFTLFNSGKGLKSESVRSITEGKDGRIYAATTRGIVIIDKDHKISSIDEPKIADSYVVDLQTGADGKIYGITMNNEIFTLDNDKLDKYYNTVKLGLPVVTAILPDDKHPGKVWIGTEGSEIYYGKLNDLKNARVIKTGSISYIMSLEKYKDQLWVCGYNGIGICEDKKFTKLDNVPMNSSVEHIMADYSGNLWFASSRQGVMKIVPNSFENVFERYNMKNEVVNSTCMFKGKLFIGTDDGLDVIGIKGKKNKSGNGVVKTVPLTGAHTASGKDLGKSDLIRMLNGYRIRSVIRDSKGNLWLSTFGEYGLVKFDGNKATCFTMQDGIPSDRIRAVYEKKDGSILVACTGGVAVIRGNKVVKVYNEDDGLINTEILTVIEAENGDIIAGSDGGGMYIINKKGTKVIDTNSGLSSNVVMRIKKDLKRDLYWIVTSNAIEYLDDNNKVTVIKKFPYSNNFDLYQNSKDEMWIVSSNGLYVIKTKEMIAAGEVSPVYYGPDNGMEGTATGNSYSELAKNGDLYIACSTGVNMVNIEESFEKVSDLKIAVPFVRADDKDVFADKNGVITIPSNTKKLTIYSFVFNYSLTNPKVTYWLDGFEGKKKTVRRSELVPVDYTNLSGGTYKFVVKLADSMDHETNEQKVTIVKEKAFYEYIWFRILVLIIALILLIFAVRRYVKKRTLKYLQKEEEDKELIREITTAFAKTIDMKDKYTNGHSIRVAHYTAMLAKEMGIDDETVEKYYNIALLHDIGKIGIPGEVLNKPGKLSDEEFAVIKSHPSLGYNVLKDISIMPELAIGAGSHHERPDGKGYPEGLKGDEIPAVANIIAVADCFDAMYSDRPYRKRMNFEKVVSIISENAGTQLDPDVVDAFLRLVDKGEFKSPDDDGGGSMETIENIRK